MDAATIRRDVEYRTTDAGPLTMDLYYPADSKAGARLPAVVFVHGFSDAGIGMPKVLGWPKMKQWAMCTSLGQLAAASGIVAIAYTNREPATDLIELLQHVRQNAAALGIDENRIGLYAWSGHAPLALFALMQERYLKCALLSCGYMLDLDGSTGVAEMAKQVRVRHSRRREVRGRCAAGTAAVHRPRRAGAVPAVERHARPLRRQSAQPKSAVTLVNHQGPHGFEIMQDSDSSRETIKQMLAFLRFHLIK